MAEGPPRWDWRRKRRDWRRFQVGPPAPKVEASRSELHALLASKLTELRELSAFRIMIDGVMAARIQENAWATRPVQKESKPPTPKIALPRKPVIPVNQSITPDAIICLIDGEKRKMLHRHLRSKYGITPDEYREHYNLPYDYPMTAPGYSNSQSMTIKKLFADGKLIQWQKRIGAGAKRGER